MGGGGGASRDAAHHSSSSALALHGTPSGPLATSRGPLAARSWQSSRPRSVFASRTRIVQKLFQKVSIGKRFWPRGLLECARVSANVRSSCQPGGNRPAR